MNYTEYELRLLSAFRTLKAETQDQLVQQAEKLVAEERNAREARAQIKITPKKQDRKGEKI